MTIVFVLLPEKVSKGAMNRKERMIKSIVVLILFILRQLNFNHIPEFITANIALVSKSTEG
jgi:hypothetical protein